MPQETINLLIGALISLVSTSVITIVNNHYQQVRDQRSRKWQIEDRESNQRREVLLKRVEETQNYLILCFQGIDRLFHLEVAISATKNENIIFRLLQETTSLLNDKSRMSTSILILRDTLLGKLNNELEVLFSQEYEFVQNYISRMQNGALIDEQNIRDRAGKFYQETMVIKAAMLNRIDEIAATLI